MALPLRKVLVADGIAHECAEILRAAGLEVTEVGKMAAKELIEQLQTHDTLLVRSATKVNREVIEACPGLRLVGRAGTGVDNIDTDSATRHGVLVMNTPGGNTLSAAEHTCVMIAALSRHLPAACASLKSGKWERSRFLGSELNGKTLAVLGLGRIGREVAHRMLAFGMKVIGYDPVVSTEAAREFHLEKRELDEIWPDADYITIHTPLLQQTKHLINTDTLSRCKRGVRVVNVARGGIVDEPALLAALESGQCAGAGLDVFAEEPPTDWRLIQHPATVCTPHLGASTGEAQLRVARELADQVVAAARGGPLAGLVNATSLSGAANSAGRRWAALAQALGALVGKLCQLSPGRPSELEIAVTGSELGPLQPLLSPSVLVGLLSGTTPNGINMVNAPLLAREAGVQLIQRWDDSDADRHTVSVRVTVAGVSHSATGTLHGDLLTLLELDGARFESGVNIDGNMLFFQGDGSDQSLTALITRLAAAHAQILTVLRSASNSRGPVLAVRVQEPLQAPQLLELEHAKFLLEASF